MGLGVWELLLILAIVLLIFGPSRLKTLGSDLGKAIKGFRSAVKHEEEEDTKVEDEPKVIEGDTPPKSRRESRHAERSS